MKIIKLKQFNIWYIYFYLTFMFFMFFASLAGRSSKTNGNCCFEGYWREQKLSFYPKINFTVYQSYISRRRYPFIMNIKLFWWYLFSCTSYLLVWNIFLFILPVTFTPASSVLLRTWDNGYPVVVFYVLK